MRRMKQFFLFVFVLGIFGGIYYHKSLEIKLVEWSLQKYSKCYFGKQITYDTVYSKSHNTLVFSHPKIQLGFGDINGKDLLIKYHLGLHGIELVAELGEGLLHLEDAILPISFYGTSQKEESAIIEFKFKDFPLYSSFLRPMAGDWTILDGTVDGNVTLKFAKHRPVHFRGVLDLDHFSFTNEGSEIEIRGEHACVRLDPLGGHFGVLEADRLSLNFSNKDRKDLLFDTLCRNLENFQFQAKAIFKETAEGILLEGIVPLEDDHAASFDATFDNSGLAEVWFEAKEIQLENLLYRVIQDPNFTAKGVVNLCGEIHHGKMEGELHTRDLLIENDQFLLSLPEIEIPLKSRKCSFQKGSLITKSSKTKIDQIQGNVLFSSGMIELTDIEGNAEGVFLLGDLSIFSSNSPKQPYHVSLQQKAMNGPLCKCKKLLESFGLMLPFQYLPLEGSFCLSGTGLEAEFSLSKRISDLFYVLEGNISDGRYSNEDYELQNLECHFTLNEQQQFHLDQLHGNLRMDNREEWILSGEGIHTENLQTAPIQFDIWLGNRKRDIVRLAGNSNRLPSGSILVNFDPKTTHLGTVHPEFSYVEFSKDFQIKAVQMRADIDLEQNFEEIKRFAHSIPFLQNISNGSGTLHASIDYSNGILHHEIEAKKIRLNQWESNHLICNGKFEENRWHIKQLTTDKMNGEARILFGDEAYCLDFIHLYTKDLELRGTNGIYNPSNHLLILPINSFTSSLGTIASLIFPSENIELSGSLQAQGEAIVDVEKLEASLTLDASLQNGIISETIIGEADHLSCRWNSKKGVAVSGHCSIPMAKAKTLSEKFLGSTPIPFDTLLAQFASNETMKLAVAFEHSAQSQSLCISLPDLNFSLFDLTEFKNLSLTLAKNNIMWKGHLFLLDQWFPFEVNSHAKSLDQGTLSIFDSQEQKVVCTWKSPNEIVSIFGQLSGIHFELEHGTQPSTLVGSIAGPLNNICQWIQHPIWNDFLKQSNIQCETKFEGVWSYSQEEDRPLFIGNLYGRDGQVFGQQIDALCSDISIHKDQVQIQNIILKEALGKAQIPTVLFEKNEEGEWRVSIPSLLGTNLRISSNQPLENPPSIMIRELQLRDFRGLISNRKTYSGTGQFSFTNPQKELVWNWIAQKEMRKTARESIPTLSPCSGTIFFEIDDEKILVSKLKDVYSDKRLIKFYLPKGENSFIDFDGNLHISIGMQPYNVFFKMDDLLTLSIEGTIQEPSYAFH